ncbi:NAD(P)-dependent oxidoreductase [Pseudodonghicola xiamenensis]|uniref:Dihydrofolate reductase n=1 Tax=Pseudodonghicola xiamenensis TaxID=337702 RepID=A0A8J3H5Q6_9RHOB|nr:NAD(P)-dependent oxidoreductase [Pseudodonghicola xiamenensis]GHG90336.1 dihydrofolate reductase [Pseudodonghicola xiamenensis]
MTTPSSAAATAGGPVIVNQIGPEVGACLRDHPAGFTVIDRLDRDVAPWEGLPDETEILLTGPSAGWRKAPTEAQPLPKRLRWVQSLSTGIEAYPRWVFEGRRFTCGRGVAASAIAEYVLTAMLDHAKGFSDLKVHDQAGWKVKYDLDGLAGKTLGILGYGAIGRAIARRAHGFEMEVLACRRGAWDDSDPYARPAAAPETLFAASDYLAIAMPLTDATRHLVDAALLAQAQPGLVLINIARGEIVDQAALVAAIDKGKLGGAVLDVTTPEPLPDGDPLYSLPNVVITPHISWKTPAFMAGFLRDMTANLDAYLAGQPLTNEVDLTRGY